MPYYSRPATVGGIVAKHGCALVPAAQIVTPLPGSVAIHGDTQRTRIRVTPPAGAPRCTSCRKAAASVVELEPA